MNLFVLSWKYIKGKPLSTALNVLLLSFGIGIIVVLLLVSQQVEEKLSENASGIDLVVGAKGSPLQIILGSIYHIDYPTGNIPLNEAAKLARNRLVKNVIPLALGDSYKSLRIVGSTRGFAELYGLVLDEGALWADDYEVTLGAAAAQTLSLAVGDTFFGEHGMADGGEAHDAHAYKVVGILQPTGKVVDNLILTSIPSVWLMHGHDEEEDGHENLPDTVAIEALGIAVTAEQLEEKEVTSLLVQYRGPMAAVQLPRMVNTQSSMQAASPAFETARLFSLIGIGVDVVQGFAYLVIVMAGLSIFIALYNSLKERQYDLAIMRSLGASRLRLFIHIVMEGVIITLLGAGVGFVLGHGVVEILAQFILKGSSASITGLVFLPSELYILYISLLLGVIASLIPAINAYKTDISEVLAKGA
ncbi:MULTISPECIES: FtsX-like permease family protein [unclassified Imperialibacter]|uniref:ABC transporter permease n=1 Tax=unclassified Imperialibacter TaxID=2629706 RepID=UPI001257372E|nr:MULTISPECIES: FtsX-like permease family protein [unclassified Imperialibacter]CAD5273633.1 ABC transporter permease [Imperialibacter sp. 89]CAD5289289.1 ABC transporter permease [Imperialibacter sp. 75]VVT13984.1 ABC transporter permease [Imperialibacter sp. EC-SDR9]